MINKEIYILKKFTESLPISAQNIFKKRNIKTEISEKKIEKQIKFIASLQNRKKIYIE